MFFAKRIKALDTSTYSHCPSRALEQRVHCANTPEGTSHPTSPCVSRHALHDLGQAIYQRPLGVRLNVFKRSKQPVERQ